MRFAMSVSFLVVVVDMQSEEEKDQTSDREAIDNLIAEQEIFERVNYHQLKQVAS